MNEVLVNSLHVADVKIVPDFICPTGDDTVLIEKLFNQVEQQIASCDTFHKLSFA